MREHAPPFEFVAGLSAPFAGWNNASRPTGLAQEDKSKMKIAADK
jgi:hypothetical protein